VDGVVAASAADASAPSSSAHNAKMWERRNCRRLVLAADGGRGRKRAPAPGPLGEIVRHAHLS
jgi:hypothetical protein